MRPHKPKSLANNIGLHTKNEAEPSMIDGHESQYRLEELLMLVNDANLHSEFDLGEPTEEEIW